MSKKNIIIIGCGAGGGTAAQFARKTDRKNEVIIFEQGPYSQYSKCGLPYAISGIIPSLNHLIEFSEEWFLKSNINLNLNTKITSIDKTNKTIIGETQEKKIIKKKYQALIIATGSQPIIPPIKNIKENNAIPKGIFTIRTINDAKEVIQYLPKRKNAVIIGAGLIGLEMADCLTKKGLHVTIVEALPQILPILDKDIANIVEKKIKNHVLIFTHHLATEIKVKNNQISEVIIQDKDTNKYQSLSTDLLILAVGTKPEIKLAEQIGCKIGETGAIKIDNTSQTSIPNVYAVGDCTEYPDYITKKPVPIGLGSIAVRQGIAAGVNAAGGSYTLPEGVLQTCTSDFFALQIASVGPSAKYLESFENISGKHESLSLPKYYPGGKQILVKTTVEVSTGKILSAQAIGENAAQRINSYATAILGDMPIDLFRKIETAYAPPVAPTLDVVTLAADIAFLKKERKKPNDDK